MKHLLWLVLISSAFAQIGTNGTTANPVPVTCISGCSGGGSSTANQGTPNTFANAWPVELTDGINLLGTPSFPVRTDPTGTTPQPVTGTFFQATQPVSGTVAVSNFPATQPVSGSVSVSNFPATQNVAVTSALPAGANVIGHVIADTGSTTAVTGNVTAVQPTGSNLHVAVDSAPSTAVTGTVTSNQGTAAASTAGWPTTSGNIAQSTATWTSATSANTNITVACSGYTTGYITGTQSVVSGGTYSISVSYDGGATYKIPLVGFQVNVSNTVSVPTAFIATAFSGLASGISTPSTYTINLIGATHFKINLESTIASGSVTFTAQASSAPGETPTPGTMSVVQATGSNLHAAIDSGTLGTVTTVSTVSASRTVGSAGGTMDGSGNAGASPANGLLTLQRYNSTAPAPTATQSMAIQGDDSGDQFVRNFRRSQYKVQATTIASSSAATTVVSAQAAATFADITSLIGTCTGTATNTATTITLSDGTFSAIFDYNTGATTTFTPATPLVIPFNPPIPATTAATAWTIALSSSAITCHFTVGFVANKAN